jgi:hypothetical protein
VLARDVAAVSDGMILCRGKERDEQTPILPETLEILRELAEGLGPDEEVIRSSRDWGGKAHRMGQDGVRKIIRLLFRRAGLEGFKGHDLRRTFATLVTEAGGDEFVATRLLRDKVPGQSDRYINYPAARLREHLAAYSPLRHLDDPMKPARSRQPTPPSPDETAPVPLDAAPKSIENVKAGGGKISPGRQNKLPRQRFSSCVDGGVTPKDGGCNGGDGGELNSVLTHQLVCSLLNQLAALGRTAEIVRHLFDR